MYKIEMIRRDGHDLILTLEILVSKEIADMLWDELIANGIKFGLYAIGMYLPEEEGWILRRWRARGIYPQQGKDPLDTVGTLGKFGVDFTDDIPATKDMDLLATCRAKVPGWAFIPVDLAAVATAPAVVEVLPSYSMASPACSINIRVGGEVGSCTKLATLSYGELYSNNVAWPDWVHYIVLQPWGRLVGYEEEPSLQEAVTRTYRCWGAKEGTRSVDLSFNSGVRWDLSYYTKICLDVTNTKQRKQQDA